MATRMPRLTGRPHRPHRLIIRMPSRLLSLYRATTRTRSRLHRPHRPLTVSRLPLRPTTASPRHLPPTRSPLPHKPLIMVSRRLPLLTTDSPPRQLLPPSRLSHRMIQPSRLPTTRTTARSRGKVSDITLRQPGQTGLPTEKTAPPIVRLKKTDITIEDAVFSYALLYNRTNTVGAPEGSVAARFGSPSAERRKMATLFEASLAASNRLPIANK